MFILFWFMNLVCLKSCLRNLSGQLASLRIQVPSVDILNCLGLFLGKGKRREEAKGDESITSHPELKKQNESCQAGEGY